MANTEFYCNASTGANINAGDLTANGVVTSTNGDWGNAAANRFTAAAGTPFSGVSVGDFASVYLDGATTAVYIGRVTAVNAGGASLDVSATAKSGTAPTNSATGRSCTTGGAWKGPNAAESFPFNFVSGVMTNAAADDTRVNFKNNAQYNITAAMTHTITGPTLFQGYTTSAGDLGRATIDGGTSGASYNMLTLSGSGGVSNQLVDLIFQNNGATGNAYGISITDPRSQAIRCVVNNIRGSGFSDIPRAIECEAYLCNKNNTANMGGFAANSAASACIRCFSHDNTGTNVTGFYTQTANCYYINCISSGNGLHGLHINNITSSTVIGCDFYNNGVSATGSGILHASGTLILNIESCNFIKNSGYGINISSGTSRGVLWNNGYGAGTQANTSGTTNNATLFVTSGTVNYASNVTPWVDPANGNFSINLGGGVGVGAINSGRGKYTETYASLSAPNTIGYPDIGAGQHQESGGAGPIAQFKSFQRGTPY